MVSIGRWSFYVSDLYDRFNCRYFCMVGLGLGTYPFMYSTHSTCMYRTFMMS